MCTEFCNGGELKTLLNKNKVQPETWVRFYAAEVVLALQHMHAHGVMHRNLKTENILIDRDGHIRLTDFGVAKGAEQGNKLGKKNTMNQGTLEYLAPEMVKSFDSYGPSGDFYMLGLVIYEMLNKGKNPFFT